ncbi:MAG: fumarylacetoacetase [Ardenticatenaceae bacterium]|nr:fumarylacetoacetase [Ardenticatenaceae bacterium]
MRSFIEVKEASHFPWQNLPYGVFSPPSGTPRVGVAIGEWVLDLSVLAEAGLLADLPFTATAVFAQPSLNAFMAGGRPYWQPTRAAVQSLLRADNPTLRDNQRLRAAALWPQTAVTMHLPAAIGDYTDFYASLEHATNVGTMFRGRENALMPNWRHLPVAYHGRASSVVVDGRAIHRPNGQTRPDPDTAPQFGPTRQLDFELEMGFFIGPGNTLGHPITTGQAPEHIFGLVLVNDWSARDIQRWEYQPLGPFLAKNFATSISPWVVPLEALQPFRQPGPVQEPAPLPHLQRTADWSLDIHLEVQLRSADMAAPLTISRSNHKYLYWDICQQLAHHTSNGCNVRPGDLLASGTISGPTAESAGSLLELTQGGKRPLRLPNGHTRGFLADGDEVILTGWCQGDGYRIGFGAVRGQIMPAAVL